MSAAEPADSVPPVMNTPGRAAVIDITKRTKRLSAAARGRWQAMNNRTDRPADNQRSERTPAEAFADDVEAAFNSVDRTLTDSDTQVVYLRTLDVVVHTLNGAHARGIIDDEQRTKLTELYEAMRHVPRLV